MQVSATVMDFNKGNLLSIRILWVCEHKSEHNRYLSIR